MSKSSITQPSTPNPPRRTMWEGLSVNFSTPSMSQPSTPLLSRRNISAYSSPRDTNPFRAEQMDKNRLDQSAPNDNFAKSFPMETNNYHQSDWLTDKNHRNIVHRATDVNRSNEMSKFDAMPINHEMPTSACPKEDTNETCQTGAHPKNAQSTDQNGNGHRVNGLCLFDVFYSFAIFTFEWR